MTKIPKKGIIAVKQEGEKKAILDQLRRVPIIQVACEKAGVSRATFYRLRNEDEKFKIDIEEAIAEGVEFICDVGESQMVSLIKDGHWPAISFLLRTRHPKYATKIQIDAKVKADEPLTKEQEELIKKAIDMLALPSIADAKEVDEQKDEENQNDD